MDLYEVFVCFIYQYVKKIYSVRQNTQNFNNEQDLAYLPYNITREDYLGVFVTENGLYIYFLLQVPCKLYFLS